VHIRRLSGNPIIRPKMDERLGNNINGPSLIKVPPWISKPLGKYYLYFAHHHGTYIRLAYSNSLEGPWNIYSPGVLDLKETGFDDHIASPDVRVIESRQEIRMYYHGSSPAFPHQITRVAVSRDGLHFESLVNDLGPAYFRTFVWKDDTYALAMPGIFLRSRDGLHSFQEGPRLFTDHMRHSALDIEGHVLRVYFTNAGDCPESILLTMIDLEKDWMEWRCSEPVLVLQPEMDFEGARLPLLPSKRDIAPEPVNQLRDPCIFKEDRKTYLLYAVAGERGIAIAEILEM